MKYIVLSLLLFSCAVQKRKSKQKNITPIGRLKANPEIIYVMDTVIIGKDTVLLMRYVDCPQELTRQDKRLNAKQERIETRQNGKSFRTIEKFDFKTDKATLKYFADMYEDSVRNAVKIARIDKNKVVKLNKSDNRLTKQLDKRLPMWKFYVYIVVWCIISFILGVLLSKWIKRLISGLNAPLGFVSRIYKGVQ